MRKFSLLFIFVLTLILGACSDADLSTLDLTTDDLITEEVTTEEQTTEEVTTTEAPTSEPTTEEATTENETTEITTEEPAQSQASVETTDDIDDALLNEDILKIVLNNNITGDIVINRLVEFDLAGYTLDGNLTIDFDSQGLMILQAGTITGNLEVDTPSSTFENYASVEGYVNVRQVSSSTYKEYASNNDIRVYANNSRVIIYADTLYLGILANNVEVTLEASLDTFGAEDSFTNIIVNNANLIREAFVFSNDVTLDGAPEVLSGNQVPDFTLPVIESLEYQSDFTYEHGTLLQNIVLSLPDEIVVYVEGNPMTVEITDYEVLTTDYDPIEDLSAQTITIQGEFRLPYGVINGNYLYPVFEISVESFRETNEIVQSISSLEDIEIEFNQVTSIEDIENNYLPQTISVKTDTLIDVSVDVDWTLINGSFDSETIDSQAFIFQGQLVNLPTGVYNLDDLTIDLNVYIQGDPNILEEPYGQIHIQPSIVGGATYNYTIDNVEGNMYVNLTIDVDPDYNYIGLKIYGTDFTVTTDLEHRQFLRSDSQWHVVIEVEPIQRIDLSTAFTSGDGSELDPFIITDTTELNNMRYFLDKGYYFELGANITFGENEYFTPMISPSQLYPFSGVLDGNGYTIYDYKVLVSETDEEIYSSFIDINEGTIKNINFVNSHIVNEHYKSQDGSLVAINNGLVDNVEFSGYREGRGGGLVGRNNGVIKDVDMDLDLLNANGGIAQANYNQILTSTVNVTMVVNQKGLGYIGGVVGSNSSNTDLEIPGVIQGVVATVLIQYQIEDVPGDDDTYIGGFAYMNKGNLATTQQAIITDSSINVTIESLIDYKLANIGGFVTENSNLGTINHSHSVGTISGRFNLGGFVAINQDGNYPGVISNSTADVDVVGTSNTIGGFVAINRGETVSTIYKGQIINSQAFGDVTGTSQVGNFAGKTSGGIDQDSVGSGLVTIITD